MPLDHVLWIGGPPGSGKTSIARRLAKTHDLAVYNADSHTYEHHYRALDAALPATLRWEAMSPDERWLAQTPEEMATHSLEMNADRFRAIVEDLRGLDGPGIIVEGTPLLPWLVAEHLASRRHAVWLIPTPDFERARLAERPRLTWNETADPNRAQANRAAREELVGRAIVQGAIDRDLRVVHVDKGRELDAITAAVEKHFAPVLERVPRAETLDARRRIRRDDNRTILRQILLYLEAVPAAGTPDTAEFPFSCECGEGGCDLVVETSAAAYERTPLLVHPDHAATVSA